MITHEATTNVNDDYRRFEILKQDLLNVHKPFQRVEHEQMYSSHGQLLGTEYDNIMGKPGMLKMEHYFHGANSIDRAMTFLGPWDVEASSQSAVKKQFDNATKARMIGNNQDIIDLILGTAELDKASNKWIVSGGFVNLLKEFKLTGETDGWEWMKESFGFRSNAMKILDQALSGKDYDISAFTNRAKLKEMPKEFQDRISVYPLAQQKIILESLQNVVDSIYNKAKVIEGEADVLLKEFHALSKKFPDRKGLASNSDTPFTNKDMIKAQKYKEDLTNSIDVYNYMSGQKDGFDVYAALNQISLEHLGQELEGLPDEEKTKALDQYIIELTNSSVEGFAPATEYEEIIPGIPN
jgi:hypothetical protein